MIGKYCQSCHGDKAAANDRAKRQGAGQDHETACGSPKKTAAYLAHFRKDAVTGKRPADVNVKDVVAKIARVQKRETHEDGEWRGEYRWKQWMVKDEGISEKQVILKWKEANKERRFNKNTGVWEPMARVYSEKEHKSDGLEVGTELSAKLAEKAAKGALAVGAFAGPNMNVGVFTGDAAEALRELGVLKVTSGSSTDQEKSEKPKKSTKAEPDLELKRKKAHKKAGKLMETQLKEITQNAKDALLWILEAKKHPALAPDAELADVWSRLLLALKFSVKPSEASEATMINRCRVGSPMAGGGRGDLPVERLDTILAHVKFT